MAGINRVSGVTLRVSSMRRSLSFYRDILGLRLLYGGEEASFSSFDIGGTYLNLEQAPVSSTDWGRVILYCDDVDVMHRRIAAKNIPAPEPRNAPWAERFFHINDPDGHELSLAQPLPR